MILVAGLSPAWQQTMIFNGFATGGVRRAAEVTWCASGKVLNVARAVAQLGGAAHALTAVGGWSGEAARRQFDAEGCEASWVQTNTPTRVCTTLLDLGGSPTTELVANTGPIAPEELARFRSRFAELVPRAAGVVLTGSWPPNVPPTFPAELLRMVPSGVPTVLDLRGPELIAALPLGPTLVKPNREELAASVGRSLDRDAELWEAMLGLVRQGAAHVLITNGAAGAWLASAEGIRGLEPPRITARNPIGSGDSLAAGAIVGLAQGDSMENAARWGMAAAIENALGWLPARFDAEAVARRAAQLAWRTPA